MKNRKRTDHRHLQLTLKDLEARKLKIERRVDNLKREYISVLQGIEQVSKHLQDVQIPYTKE